MKVLWCAFRFPSYRERKAVAQVGHELLTRCLRDAAGAASIAQALGVEGLAYGTDPNVDIRVCLPADMPVVALELLGSGTNPCIPVSDEIRKFRRRAAWWGNRRLEMARDEYVRQREEDNAPF